MLISTDTNIYRLQVDSADDPVLMHEGTEQVAAVAESRPLCAYALSEGRLCLQRPGGGNHSVRLGLEEPIESLLVLRADPLDLLIGTEGAHLFRLGEDGVVRRVSAFDDLDCREKWHTPWGGPPAVRSMAPSSDGYVYADIHVGSIMRSADGGSQWEPVTPTLHEDVHQVNTCPIAPNRVYANTANGVYISENHGSSWRHCPEGIGARYGRAITAKPDEPDVILATVSDGPHGDNVHGQLYRSADAGMSWEQVTDGFPDSTEDNINTHRVAFDQAGIAWATAGNRLYRSEDALTFTCRWEAPEPIEAISCSAI
ncbi:MAG: WD40/YVTN/BNR-like repeat-containing protein [Phycisphaerae bacterium]